MSAFTLQELQCFDAVVRHGGFQAAAEQLHRSHPSVYAAVAKLEHQLGVALLDRSGYRVNLAVQRPAGVGEEMAVLLREAQELRTYAQQLAMGEESELRVVLGDLCPLPPLLGLLGGFFKQ
jgi:DNA-binding transcriptional LysR family regulator